MTYNTKQKEIILDIIEKQHNSFTVKDIYNKLDKKIGLTTIYRLVDKLLKEDKLKKYIDNDNNTYYQYLESCNSINHFYLKCEKCGSIKHIDCDCIEELSNHILSNHNFIPSKDHIVIDGICNKCK